MTVMTLMCCVIIIHGNLLLCQQLLDGPDYFEEAFMDTAPRKRKSTINENSNSRNVKKRKIWLFLAALVGMFRDPLPKSDHWFDIAMNQYNDAQFKEAFGIERTTFDFLCSVLRPFEKRINVDGFFTKKGGKRAVTFMLAVGITVYRLTSTLNVRRIAQKFGVSKGTVSVLSKEVINLICSVLKQRYITWPGEFEQSLINRAFYEKRGIPGIVGIIDGTHIPIQLLHKNMAPDYYCRKGFYSINVQAIVDHNMMFRDVYVGWPGSCPDGRVWRNSPIGIRAQQESRVPVAARTLFYDNNFIIGDGGYGLKPYLLVPFQEKTNMPFSRKLYNFAHSSTRMLVENTFARLKNRFATLRNKVNFKTDELICKAIVACMVIHNLCILLNDEVLVQEMELDIHNDPVPVFNEQVFGQEPRPKSKRGRIARSLLTKFRQNPELFARR